MTRSVPARALSRLLSLALLAGLASCNALLGIDDPIVVATDAESPGADASADAASDTASDASNSDTSDDSGDTHADGAPPDTGSSDGMKDAPDDAGCNYAATVLADKPIAYFRLGEASGAGAANLGSNTSITGGYASMAITYGVSPAVCDDKAVRFGASGSFGVGNLPLFQSAMARLPFSLEIWFKPDALSGTPKFILGRATTDSGYLLEYDSTRVYFHAKGAASASVDEARGPALTTTAFHHLVATYDGAFMKLYIDGVTAASAPSSALFATDPPDFDLAITAISGLQPGLGAYDELAIYDKPLGADRVLAHYNAR